MKKFLALLLVMVMVFSMAACSSSDDKKEEGAKTENTFSSDSDEPLGSVEGLKIGFINAGPDDYYAAFGNGFITMAESK